ncbi:MAG: hypothetical protein LQ338_001743 [Usnochroma carphineum]|nr:MAG: hypothetical protein LQ338_001743 [Usnochroma carphineum]
MVATFLILLQSSVHSRSEITLEDEKTKFGTEIDGQRVASGARSTLKNNEHTFRLGKTSHIFRIKWQPTVLSVSSSPKEIKAGKDTLAALRNRLEGTDIKVVNTYIIGSTTHVVQGKRNTAKGLQALINGKYIVTESFVDALIYATTSGDLDADESLSPLEEDYDKHWPDEMQHLPSKGNEPKERPAEKFAPDPGRINVFEGYTVVFCDKGQFDTLQPPITNGGGKALYFQLRSGQTTTDELVGFIKNVAGEKGLGELEDGSEGKGVVVVKFRGNSKDDYDWAVELGREASLALDLRFIEQNEFMDAILMNDASVLRRPLEAAENDDEPDSSNRAATQQGIAPAVAGSQPEPSQPPPPARRQRGLIKSRFKGFSSDEDEQPSLTSIPLLSQSHPSQPQAQTPNDRSQAPNNNPLKRPAPPPEEDDTDLIDQLLPAAAAMKRRRLEAIEEARRRGDSPPPAASTSVNQTASAPATTAKAPEKKQQKEPIDIKASLRSRREAADAALAEDEEALRNEDLTPAAIESMRNLAVVEEFDVASPRSHRASSHSNGTNPRWDPAWNGRKNFKKFRRQGEGGGDRRRGVQNVIVPLEEVKKKDAGIGDGYWLESGESLKRKRKERASQSQVAVEGESEGLANDDFGTGSSERTRRKGKENGKIVDVAKELLVDDDSEMPDSIVVSAPRRTRGMMMDNTQPQPSSSSAAVGGKAKAKNLGRGGRQKQTLVAPNEEENSESEDELKFRFGKRRRLQQ